MKKFLKRRSSRKHIPSTAECSAAECSGPAVASPAASLGTGNFSATGTVLSFVPSRHRDAPIPSEAAPSGTNESQFALADESTSRVFSRHTSSFLRVGDLNMKEAEKNNDGVANFHYVSVHPPPGVEMDHRERWVALDDGAGKHAPIASAAVQALATTGLKMALLSEMWTADWKTSKLLKQGGWGSCTFDLDIPIPETTDHEVFLWYGKFHHGLYGSDLPAVRAAAVIDMSAEDLVGMLVDSSRVFEYNAMSLGRKDLMVLQSDFDGGPFGGITKLICNETRPPMLRKTLRFTSIFHARTLSDGCYQLVTRAVCNAMTHSVQQQHHVLVSEILLGVNVIRRINDSQCLFVTVNHIRSPMVPLMIAKRFGLQSAVSFIHDLRGCC